MSRYALQAIRMLSVPPEVTWTTRRRAGEMLRTVRPSLKRAICDPHDQNSLCHRRWVLRGRACTPFGRPPPPSFSRQERCQGGGDCSTQSLRKPWIKRRPERLLLVTKKKKEQKQRRLPERRRIQRCIPSPADWSEIRRPSTRPPKRSRSPTAPHLQPHETFVSMQQLNKAHSLSHQHQRRHAGDE